MNGWTFDVLKVTLAGYGHRVELGKVSDARALWALLTEAAEADLTDAALAGLLQELAVLLPPVEILHRADRLRPEDVQAICLYTIHRRNRPRRANARPAIYVTEAP